MPQVTLLQKEPILSRQPEDMVTEESILLDAIDYEMQSFA